MTRCDVALGDRRYSSIAQCGTGGRIKSGHDGVPDAVGVTGVLAGRRADGLRSAFGRGGGDWNLAGFRLIAHARGALVVALFAVVLVALAILVALVTVALLVVPALVGLGMLLLWRLTVRLPLLLGLVHGVKNTEVMFRVLEERFRCHPVSTTGRVAAELEVFFEKLLGGAADADFRPVAVENVVAIKRDIAA
jgi:hypothetical protein